MTNPKPTQVQFRCPAALYDAIQRSVAKSGRNIRAELIAILSAALGVDVEYSPPGRRWPAKKIAAPVKPSVPSVKKVAKKPTKKAKRIIS
jgi:hypothetical protein